MSKNADNIVSEKRKRVLKVTKKLKSIDSSMIENGVLTIREGVTAIETNLDELLEEAGITDKITCVMLPKSLQKMDNFFYNNKSVKLVIFNSPVALTSKKKQGSFENSNVEEIIIYNGFLSIDLQEFHGEIENHDRSYRVATSKEGFPLIPISFFNCHSLKTLTVMCNLHDFYIMHISTTSCRTLPGISYNELYEKMVDPNNYNRFYPTVTINGVTECLKNDVLAPEYIENAIKKYQSSFQLTMAKPPQMVISQIQ